MDNDNWLDENSVSTATTNTNVWDKISYLCQVLVAVISKASRVLRMEHCENLTRWRRRERRISARPPLTTSSTTLATSQNNWSSYWGYLILIMKACLMACFKMWWSKGMRMRYRTVMSNHNFCRVSNSAHLMKKDIAIAQRLKTMRNRKITLISEYSKASPTNKTCKKYNFQLSENQGSFL